MTVHLQEHSHNHNHDHHHAPTLQEWAKATLLLSLSVYMALLMLTGNVNNYINQRFQWLVVLACVIFGVLGVFQVWQAWLASKPATPTKPQWGGVSVQLPPDHDHDHDHSLSWGAILVVSVPILLALVFPSRPLGAEAVMGGISLNPVGVGNAETFSRSPKDRNILDWLREFNRINNSASFNGQEVDIIGFVYREAGMGDNEFMIARFTMSCCVADAFAIGLPVRIEGGGQYTTGTWLRIEGTLQAGMFEGESVPIVQPITITPTDVPDSPYLYS